MSKSKRVITIVLLGKDGIGKKTVKNALGDTEDNNSKCFESILFEKNIREEYQNKWLIFKTSGIRGRETLEKAEGLKETCDYMLRLMKFVDDKNLNGISVFLLVFNIHGRYQQEDKKITEVYEQIFGKSEFWKHCIVVMTGGESFEGNFDLWLKQQEGEFEQLLKKCDNRIVLISTKRNERMYESSRKKLVTDIEHFQMTSSTKYSLNQFMQNEKARNILVLQTEIREIRGNLMREIEQFEKDCYENHRTSYVKLETARKYARLELAIINIDNGTGLLTDLLNRLEYIFQTDKTTNCFIL